MRTQPDKVVRDIVKKKHKITFLDSTGSMHGAKHESAKAGVLNDIENCKELGFDSFTLIEFVQYDKIYTKTWTNLSKINPVFHSPNGINTPLYHTLGTALVDAFSKYDEDDAVLFNLFTDGKNEGSQGEYSNPSKVAELVQQAETLGWTVTFIGTGRDVESVIRNLKLNDSNVLVHDNTSLGIKQAFKINNEATMNYSKSVDRGLNVTTNFYTKTIEE